ncbi:MAG: ribonuclease H-like domain-containing protein [Patescibacteria group bacterium]
MPKLIFDIETIGENYDELDETTQNVMTKWIKGEEGEDEHDAAVREIKKTLGLSPLTGEIVAIGVLDGDKNKGAVYYQAPGTKEKDSEEDGIKFRPMDEKGMLKTFWEVAEKYDEFISFNGRGFDAPYLMIRSAIHGLRPSQDLMFNRYLGSQKYNNAKHIDLMDQLSFYGATRNKSLHLYCRAFGIKSPKAYGVSGDDVAGLFREGRFLDIARYNVGDLVATKALYERWEKYMKF